MLEFLAPKLAKWQLPDDVVFIDEVPKTSVGKFSKKDLRTRFADYAARLTSRDLGARSSRIRDNPRQETSPARFGGGR